MVVLEEINGTKVASYRTDATGVSENAIILEDSDVNKILEVYRGETSLKNPYHLNPNKVVEDVAECFGISYKELKTNTRCRARKLLLARQCVLYILYKCYYGSLTEVSSVLNKDHATVIHSIDVIENAFKYKDKLYMDMMIPPFIMYNIWDKKNNCFFKFTKTGRL